MVFVTTSGRTFALTFGQTRHSLRDEAYEYDFGLRTTLNAVEPSEIRNTDELDPATSRRRRTQLPEHADLTYFDFDGNSSVLRSLTGAIRPEYADLFTHATGANNLRVSSKKPIAELTPLLDEIYSVYNKTVYLEAFPAANNIQPVADPSTLNRLNDALVDAIRINDDHVTLTIPELVDFQQDFEITYSGAGRSDLYTDASLFDYYDYLTSNGRSVSELTLESLRSHRLRVLSDTGFERASYSIYRCTVFEVTLNGFDGVFHLSEGTWYQVDADYLARLTTDLDEYFSDTPLPPREVHLESEYNRDQLVPHWVGSVLLDTTDTSPAGEKQVEPCDVIRVENGLLVLTHVKLGVKASALSHLFSQGANSVDLLNGEPEAREILSALILDRSPEFDIKPLDHRSFAVEYVIVTKNDLALRSSALPLFSRISLRRAIRSLAGRKTATTVYLVADEYVGESREKPRKARKPKESVKFG